MFSKQDAAQAAGENFASNKNAPTNKGKGAKVSKRKHFNSLWLPVLSEVIFIVAVVAMVLWGVAQ